YLLYLFSPPPPLSTLFPYTTLFRSCSNHSCLSFLADVLVSLHNFFYFMFISSDTFLFFFAFLFSFASTNVVSEIHSLLGRTTVGDRKSTRLNSSHGSISYAVFCLKK